MTLRLTKILQSLTLGLALLAAATAHSAIIAGKEWMQLTETTQFTYNDVAGGVCHTGTGLCSGVATNSAGRSLDLTGWVWASAVDIADLFELITGAPDGTFDADSTSFSSSATLSSWGSVAIDIDGIGPDFGLFDATWVIGAGDHFVGGLTRTVINGDSDRSFFRRTTSNDLAVVGNPHGFDTSRTHTGLWLFRTAEVSEPPLLWLLSAGFVGLLFRSKMKRSLFFSIGS